MSKGMRKKIAVLLTAAIAAAGLSACGGNGSDNSGGGQDTESKAGTSKEETKTDSEKNGGGEDITIRLLTRMSGADSGTKLKEEVRMRAPMTATALQTSSRQILHPGMWQILSSGRVSVS